MPYKKKDNEKEGKVIKLFKEQDIEDDDFIDDDDDFIDDDEFYDEFSDNLPDDFEDFMEENFDKITEMSDDFSEVIVDDFSIDLLNEQLEYLRDDFQDYIKYIIIVSEKLKYMLGRRNIFKKMPVKLSLKEKKFLINGIHANCALYFEDYDKYKKFMIHMEKNSEKFVLKFLIDYKDLVIKNLGNDFYMDLIYKDPMM
jgi:hypothetical protein